MKAIENMTLYQRMCSPKTLALLGGILVLAILLYGSWNNPDFWFTADQRGDHLMAKEQYNAAANVYTDPWRKGVAQYRNGDFEDAARTFARVPGAKGAFNQGNAWLMHGKYDIAIKSYDRALGFKPRWQEAEDNKALAKARQKRIEDAGKDRDQESADAHEPDDIVYDQKGDNQPAKPRELSAQDFSDSELRANWLRRVQTTPSDFLRAKFAWQAAHAEPESPDPQNGGEPKP